MSMTVQGTIFVLLSILKGLAACQAESNHLVLQTEAFPLDLTADKALRCSPYVQLPNDVPCETQRITVHSYTAVDTNNIARVHSLSLYVDDKEVKTVQDQSVVSNVYYAPEHLKAGDSSLLTAGQKLQACARDLSTHTAWVDIAIWNNAE